MTEFLKESFNNGNRLTNILLIIITFLVSIVGYFGAKIYDKIDNMQAVINTHETRIVVIEGKIGDIKERMLNDLRDEIRNKN